MIQTKITEPTRTPFNPHGFADATPLHAFYLELLEKGLINKVLEEGNLEFENQKWDRVRAQNREKTSRLREAYCLRNQR